MTYRITTQRSAMVQGTKQMRINLLCQFVDSFNH
jgi:hypothetical protein